MSSLCLFMHGFCMMNADKQTYPTQTGPRIHGRTSGTTYRERKPGPLENIQSDGGKRYQETKISACKEKQSL